MGKSEMRKRNLYILFVPFFFACQDNSTDADLGVQDASKDMKSAQDGKSTDVGIVKDLGEDEKDQADVSAVKDLGSNDMGADIEPDLGEAAGLILTRTKDNQAFTFSDYYFGRNLDSTLHVELFVKGSGSCPKMDDPTPEETMIFTIDSISGVSESAIILDFAGKFEPVNPTHPSTINVEKFTFKDDVPSSLFLKISGEDKHETSHFQYSGSFRATHCSSLDE